ncbi:MAG: hypothetical protein F6J97_10790 [Leptolyngbya sp. SIO4C1]|nr:hypothetical protein [Leptolyngbya sp. SIO4C1]
MTHYQSRLSKTASPRPRRLQRRPRTQAKAWLAGGSMVALAAIALIPDRVTSQQAAQAAVCQTVIQADARLSREQLSRLLSVPQSSSKEAISRITDQPYCVLKAAEPNQQREAYPLAFDPKTWLVIQYEQESYSGYDFIFKP